MINRYQAFAEWRIGTHRSSNRGRNVRFFRKTRDHTVIWTVVMPPVVVERARQLIPPS